MADLYIETEQLKKYGDRLLTSKANLEMYLTELNNAVTNITDGWNDDCGVNFKEKFADFVRDSKRICASIENIGKYLYDNDSESGIISDYEKIVNDTLKDMGYEGD